MAYVKAIRKVFTGCDHKIYKGINDFMTTAEQLNYELCSWNGVIYSYNNFDNTWVKTCLLIEDFEV